MTEHQKSYDEDEIDLIDYLNVVVKRRRMILRTCVIAAIAMAVISLFLPKTYTATTTLLPPDESEQPGLQSLLANSPVGFLNLPGLSGSTSEIFVEILKSRTVAELVLNRKYAYDDREQVLYTILGEDRPAPAIEALQQSSKISSDEQGMISISVELKNPELAAQVANAYADELDRVNQEKSLSKAKNSRIYIEEQLEITEQNLETASQALARFQEKYQTVDLEEQTKVAITKAGEIKGTIMAKEVEMQVALQMMKPNNPYLKRLQAELDELNKQFEHLQFGNSVPFEEQKNYFIPFSDVPEVALRYAELIREVKVQETVWQLLNQQYYSTKIQEARDTPTVQVLDIAVAPELRTSPKRAFLVIVATALAFFFAVFAAFVMEYAERVRGHQEQYSKLSHIKSELSGDVQKIRERADRYWRKLRNR